MKKAFFLMAVALMYLPAQAQTIITDSLAPLFLVGNVHFQTRHIIRDNGESEIITTRIGDTATVKNFLLNQSIDAGREFSQDAIKVLSRAKELNKIRDLAAGMQGAIGVDLFALTRELYYLEFVDTIGIDKDWQWRTGTTTALKIRKLANGGLLRISGLPGISGANRNIDFLAPDWIRIQNFPTGSVTYLYQFDTNGRWFTIDRGIELRLTGVTIKPGQ